MSTEVTYNGQSLGHVKTRRIGQRPQFDPSRTDELFTLVSLEFDSLVYLQPGPGGSPAEQMAALRHVLTVPRRSLLVTVGGKVFLNVPAGLDCANGPVPDVFDIHAVADNVFRYTWACEAAVRECQPTGVTSSLRTPASAGGAAVDPSAVISNRWTQEESVDDKGYHIITTAGRLIARSDMRVNPAAFRAAIKPPPRTDCTRQCDFKLQADGLAMDYTIIDKERYLMPPPWAVDAKGTWTSTAQNFGTQWFGEVNVSLTGAKDTPQALLYLTAFSIAQDRMNAGKPLANRKDGRKMVMGGAIRQGLYENTVEVMLKARLEQPKNDGDPEASGDDKYKSAKDWGKTAALFAVVAVIFPPAAVVAGAIAVGSAGAAGYEAAKAAARQKDAPKAAAGRGTRLNAAGFQSWATGVGQDTQAAWGSDELRAAAQYVGPPALSEQYSPGLDANDYRRPDRQFFAMASAAIRDQCQPLGVQVANPLLGTATLSAGGAGGSATLSTGYPDGYWDGTAPLGGPGAGSFSERNPPRPSWLGTPTLATPAGSPTPQALFNAAFNADGSPDPADFDPSTGVPIEVADAYSVVSALPPVNVAVQPVGLAGVWYQWADVEISHEVNPGCVMMPAAKKGVPPAKLQMHEPTLKQKCSMVAKRAGRLPVLPDPTPVDPTKWLLLDRWETKYEEEGSINREAPVFVAVAEYTYGYLGLVSDIDPSYPIPPWLDFGQGIIQGNP